MKYVIEWVDLLYPRLPEIEQGLWKSHCLPKKRRRLSLSPFPKRRKKKERKKKTGKMERYENRCFLEVIMILGIVLLCLSTSRETNVK